VTAAALAFTPSRGDLAEAVARGVVKHYNWQTPTTFWDDWRVTAKVAELVRAGYATIPATAAGDYSWVQLTAEGKAWLAAGRERAS
jgi:hypothetical protein